MKIKRWQINLTAYLLIAFWTFWPILSVATAFFMAWLGNAQVDEGSMHPCIIGGHDFGEPVYTLFVLGWFGLWTLPTGALAFLVYTLGSVTEWLIAKHRRKTATAHSK